MNFYSRYKDLFEIPNGLSIPSTRLTLNNDLFIDKPYVPTYTQQFNLNNKLMQLRKDYSQLEEQINQINVVPQIQRKQRLPSRKKQQKIKKQFVIDDRNNDIIKHSQMNFIFNNKIKNAHDWDIPQTTVRKMPQLIGNSNDRGRQSPYLRKLKRSFHKEQQNDFSSYQQNRKRNNFVAGQQYKFQTRTQKNQRLDGASARREQAKKNLALRRDKLARLLKLV